MKRAQTAASAVFSLVLFLFLAVGSTGAGSVGGRLCFGKRGMAGDHGKSQLDWEGLGGLRARLGLALRFDMDDEYVLYGGIRFGCTCSGCTGS